MRLVRGGGSATVAFRPVGLYMAEFFRLCGELAVSTFDDGRQVVIANSLADLISLAYAFGEQHDIASVDIAASVENRNRTLGLYRRGVGGDGD